MTVDESYLREIDAFMEHRNKENTKMLTAFKSVHPTCRVCGVCGSVDEFLKYGVRHYAHPKCGLERFGAAFFDRLQDWQLRNFPYMTAVDAGLKNELAAKINALPKIDTTPVKM